MCEGFQFFSLPVSGQPVRPQREAEGRGRPQPRADPALALPRVLHHLLHRNWASGTRSSGFFLRQFHALISRSLLQVQDHEDHEGDLRGRGAGVPQVQVAEEINHQRTDPQKNVLLSFFPVPQISIISALLQKCLLLIPPMGAVTLRELMFRMFTTKTTSFMQAEQRQDKFEI